MLRHYWKKGLTQRDAAEEICKVEGAGIVCKSAVGKWFKRFNEGNFDLDDKPHSGAPLKLNDNDLQAKLNIAPSLSTRHLATELGTNNMTVWRHLKKLGFAHKKPREDSHELTEVQARKRVEICRRLLNNPLDDRF